MNTTRFNKAIQELHALRMNPQEKSMLHDRIMDAIRSGKAAQVGGAMPGAVTSPWHMHSFQEWMGMHRVASIAVAVFAIVILGGGGVALAAQGSLPGDSLYPLKVAVIEPIRGAVFISAGSKARYEAELVATRLAEADTLEEEGKLDTENQAKIRMQVALHTHAYEKAAREAASSDDLTDARVAIERGTSFLAVSDTSYIGSAAHAAGATRPAVAAKAAVMVSATATIPTRPALMNAAVKVKASGAVVIPASVSSPATTSDTGSPLPHINDIQTVKNVIKGTAAVVNAVTQMPAAAVSVPTAAAAIVPLKP